MTGTDPLTILVDMIADAVAPRVAALLQAPPAALALGPPRAPKVEWLRTADVAKLLQLAPTTLEIKRIKGDGPPFHKIGRAVRYKRSEVDDYLDAQRRTNTIKAAPKSTTTKRINEAVGGRRK